MSTFQGPEVADSRMNSKTSDDSYLNAHRKGPRLQLALFCFVFAMTSSGLLGAQSDEMLPDISGMYQFLGPDDTLAILEEEENVNGYVDVVQGEDESDAILSYSIATGRRQKNQIEFTTRRIHQKYYRFRGKVERGQGGTENDPDYLRLVGALDIVTVKGETGEESAQQKQVVFKSLGREQEPEE